MANNEERAGGFCVRGAFIHPTREAMGAIEIIRDGLIVVDARGIITRIFTDARDAATAADLPTKTYTVARGGFCVPGFVDLHVHAPQYQFTGTATDKPLMEWLEAYTFPAERRMADTARARKPVCGTPPDLQR